MPERVAIGMSGGIDSSVAAALLVDAGCEVIGLSLHMFKEGSRCCSIEDVNRARRVCDHLGIRHYVMNVVDDFRDAIVKPFTDAYATGTTPNPCIFCNRDFKFGALLRRARQLDCAKMATGHYCRVEQRADGFHLLRGRDGAKDQSYFLHRLSQDQLAGILFPLGNLTKPEVRAIAREKALPIEGARETADLCFITAKGPAPLVESFHPEVARKGSIVTGSGKTLGAHQGIHHFTIGQRKGLGVAAGSPLYVKRLDPAANTVTLAPKEELFETACAVSDIHWTTPTPPRDGDTVEVKIRYRTKAAPATLRMLQATSARLTFLEPQFAITPGQAAVLYHGDEVLGGGWIGREG